MTIEKKVDNSKKRIRRDTPIGLKSISEDYGFTDSKKLMERARKRRTTPIGINPNYKNY